MDMSTNHSAPHKNAPVVLAVDDDPGVLKIIELALARGGYAVQTAGDAAEALAILRNLVPAVLILDVKMPQINGFQLLQKIKLNERLASVPALFLTGEDRPQDFRAGYSLGAVVYMVKPFNPEHLLKMVQMLAPATSG